MRELKFENYIQYISFMDNIIDKTWLSKEMGKIRQHKPPKDLRKLTFLDYTAKFHPLAFLIYSAHEQLKSGSAISEEIFRLAYLGENLYILDKNNTKNLSNKIADLTSLDKDSFEKTFFEIQIASAYARKNIPVEFIETSEEKTPDILVHFGQGIEIECKKKNSQSAREKKNKENWKYLMTKASGIMEHFKSNYALFVKTQRDPTKEDVAFILTKLNTLIEKNHEGQFAFEKMGIGITLHRLSSLDEEIKSNGIQFNTNEDLDFMACPMEKHDGRELIRNPRIFGFKSAQFSDRLKSVIESLKVAKEQLSGTRPSLIYVNLNSIDKKLVDRDFEILDKLIAKILKENSRITGVIISSEFLNSGSEGIRYSHRTRFFKNENATYAVPEDFEIVGRNTMC